MKLTAIEINNHTYPVAVVGINEKPCEECALCDLCHNNERLECLCAYNLSENECFITE